ncbi:MAG: hypothetical protein IJW46_08015 [Clostridia bacterium]|nr:hypothetical protein [Clostridia bacterium]
MQNEDHKEEKRRYEEGKIEISVLLKMLAHFRAKAGFREFLPTVFEEIEKRVVKKRGV